MATAFMAMNDSFGPIYPGCRAEAQTPQLADARAAAPKGRFIMGMHTHFLRDDTRLDGCQGRHPAHGGACRLHARHAGLANLCMHKGLAPPSITRQYPERVRHADVRDVGKAARDWPELNFIICHSGFRVTGGAQVTDWVQFETSGRIDCMRYGAPTASGPVTRNGRSRSCVVWRFPRKCRKKHGFQPLGAADGPVKSAIFGANPARLDRFTPQQRVALADDPVPTARAESHRHGEGRSNLRYGHIRASATG